MQVDFYHLTASPLERVLPRIAERVLSEGGRLLVVEADAQRRDALDRLLWEYVSESFLPHAQVGTADDAAQPVLLAAEPVAANGARIVALADGRWRDEALGFDRALLFFGEDQVAAARAAWKGFADRTDITRSYWRQRSGGGWDKAG